MNQSMLNKIMTKVSDLSTGRIALVSLVLTVMYFLTGYEGGGQLQTQIDGIKAKIEEEKVKKIETNRVLQKEEQMRADVAMLVKKYEDVKSKIPIEFLESELRIIIDQLATQFELKTIKNQRTTRGKDFGTTLDANLVEQVALEYSFAGNFYSLQKLVKQIADTDKLVKVENFELIRGEKNSNPNAPQPLVLNATIVGFKQSSVAMNQNKNQPGGAK